MTSSPATLNLYRSFLRTARGFSAYNFREYALRRTKDAFHMNKDLTDPEEVQMCLKKANEELAILKRQTAISQMYQFQKLVVE
ncbi:complex 1 protein-domain-containing protein [Lipomyces oligophaga]|uniref:complex 1 protein-domain-containing protein n=1 Tax=Lipomyces oligophaga TaxID=45792 RepID=UPI0034CFB204